MLLHSVVVVLKNEAKVQWVQSAKIRVDVSDDITKVFGQRHANVGTFAAFVVFLVQ